MEEGVQLDSVKKAIKEIRRGSLDEYGNIVQKYQQSIFKYCYHMLDSEYCSVGMGNLFEDKIGKIGV